MATNHLKGEMLNINELEQKEWLETGIERWATHLNEGSYEQTGIVRWSNSRTSPLPDNNGFQLQ